MEGCESRVVGQFGILVSAADECRPEGRFETTHYLVPGRYSAAAGCLSLLRKLPSHSFGPRYNARSGGFVRQVESGRAEGGENCRER